jgi:hypothetical protein
MKGKEIKTDIYSGQCKKIPECTGIIYIYKTVYFKVAILVLAIKHSKNH